VRAAFTPICYDRRAMIYRALVRILRLAVSIFFRQVEVAGGENVPPDGAATIFAGNHPNSLLDPVLILTTCGRVTHFAAKDVLFRGRVMRWLLGRLGAVPVARRSDHGDGPLDNRSTFDALAQVLEAGEAMGIFPEGLSHDAPELQRLKTGAARIALEAARRGTKVQIVPCGLNYLRPKRFRSRVLVQYGAPIAVEGELIEQAAADEREAVRTLTARVERSLRGLTVNARDFRTLRVLDAVRRLYQPAGISLEQRIELARRFNDVYPTVQAEPEVQATFARVAAWLDRLRALGLTERELSSQLGPLRRAATIARQVALALLWLPLAAPGIVLHAPLGLAIGWAGHRLTPRKDALATTKLVLGLTLVPLGYGAAMVWVGFHFGAPWALAAAALLVVSGHATLRVLERGTRAGQLVAASLRALGLSREIASLREERRALVDAVVRAVDRFRPPEMVPLFPRTASEPAP
jgi:1-acyl-sn-glycerol-3-phosphate acyltransferase